MAWGIGREMLMDEEISIDESMRQCLLHFESAAHSVVKSPEEIFEEFGAHAGVSWELRQELLSGRSLLEWSGISDRERRLIGGVVRETEAMPAAAFCCSGELDLHEPSWGLVREAASKFIELSDG